MPKLPSGSVFKRRYRDSNGQMTEAKLWTIKYYVDGKPKQEPTETADHGEAVAFLRRRMADNAVATVHTGYPERVTMNQLFDLLVQDYILRKKRSLYDCETRVNARLRPYFGGMKAQGVGTATLRQYIQRRRGEEAQDATINRELALVRRALNLGAQEQPPLVLNVPHFPMLPVDNARQGTLDHEPYRLLRDALPLYARIALVIAYYTGARHGEISSIQRAWVNLKAGRINLPGRVTKNGKPRYLPIYGEMKGELDMWLLRIADSACPFLIQDDGARVETFYKAWRSACKTAKVPGTLFHDLRRTALTNMIEAGLSEKEAMEISGHRTRYVFDRYHIVSDRRMKQNADKLAEHMKTKEKQSHGDQPVTNEAELIVQ